MKREDYHNRAKHVEAVILAAGYSSRMGEPKPLLPLGGTTVIRRQVEMLKGLAQRTVVVTGYRAEEVEDHLLGSGADCVRNPGFAAGMLSSVQTGIRALGPETQAFLILPVDVPLVAGRMIRELIEMYASQEEALVVYPSCRMRKGHPPVISAACKEKILTYSGDMGLKGALKPFDSRARFMETEDARCTMDMDTPEDYRRILAVMERGCYNG